MSQDEETPIEVTLGGVIDTLEHALTLSQESTPPAPSERAPSEAERAVSGPYRVQPRYTWESIAEAHGVDVDALYEANADQQRVIAAGRAGMPVGALIVIPA